MAWTSPTLPQLQEELCGGTEECQGGMGKSEEAWIGAAFPLGAMLGVPMAGMLQNTKLGKKWTLVLLSLCTLLGNALLLSAAHIGGVNLILLGRLISGVSGGSFALVIPLYVSDIARPDMRGALSSGMALMLTAGILTVNALSIGNFLGWRAITIASCVAPVLLCLTMPLMPESPRHLLHRFHDRDAARRALLWLRGGNEMEAAIQLKSLEEEIQDEDKKNGDKMSSLRLLGNRQYSRPLLVSLLLMLLNQASGINVVIFYAQTIFKHAGSHMDPGLSSTLVSVGQVSGNLISLFLVDRFGRRPLLLASQISVAIATFIMGAFFHAKHRYAVQDRSYSDNFIAENETKVLLIDAEIGSDSDSIMEGLTWVPLASLIFYIVTFQMGLGSLPWIMNAELSPPVSLSVSSSLAASFCWLCAFVVTWTGPRVEEVIGTHGLYYSFTCISVIGILFLAMFVPETKGKTSTEIAAMFDKSIKIAIKANVEDTKAKLVLEEKDLFNDDDNYRYDEDTSSSSLSQSSIERV